MITPATCGADGRADVADDRVHAGRLAGLRRSTALTIRFGIDAKAMPTPANSKRTPDDHDRGRAVREGHAPAARRRRSGSRRRTAAWSRSARPPCPRTARSAARGGCPVRAAGRPGWRSGRSPRLATVGQLRELGHEHEGAIMAEPINSVEMFVVSTGRRARVFMFTSGRCAGASKTPNRTARSGRRRSGRASR